MIATEASAYLLCNINKSHGRNHYIHDRGKVINADYHSKQYNKDTYIIIISIRAFLFKKV